MHRNSRLNPTGLFSSPWPGLIVVAITFITGAALTWRKWPDVLVDFGMQLYLPWRISSGSVLYRDVMYLTGGPLSQYYDALLFRLFGVSLLTLVISNLVVAAGLLLLIYRRFLAASDAWTATTICLGITLVFAFAQYSDIGNFNFITPYCHEVWHGLVLSIVTIALLSDWVAKERTAFASGAGFCSGLVFMTKPEVFAALAVTVTGAFVLFGMTKGTSCFILKSLAAFASAFLVPLIGFVLYFHRVGDWPSSLRSVAFAWVPLLSSSIAQGPFYKWCLGLDMPGHNLRTMFIHFLVISIIAFLLARLFRRGTDRPVNRLLAVGILALLLALASGFDWVDCGRSLPLLSLALCVMLATKYKELSPGLTDIEIGSRPICGGILLPLPAPQGEGEDLRLSRESVISTAVPPVFPLLWAIFGLALLAKLGLYSRVWHYGFALAMPAFAAAIYLLHWLLPQRLEKHGVQRRLFRGAIWLLLMTGFVRLFVQSQFLYRDKTVAVGRGADQIMAFDEKRNPAGPAIRTVLPWIEKNIPPDATLAVLPEGIMINYLSRRANPTRYFVWNPPELSVFGQAGMAAAFRDHNPDYILLIHRDAAEYGAKYFGQQKEFGLELMQWIQTHYEPVLLIGNEPLQSSSFGIKILKRNANRKD